MTSTFPSVSVQQIWRYPVKSMLGSQLSDADIEMDGIVGDRAYAIRDESRHAIQGARRHGKLMACRASLDSPARAGTTAGPVRIDIPGGSTVTSDDENANDQLSAFLETPVTLWPRLPTSERKHYRRERQAPWKAVTELKSQMDVRKGDALPRLLRLPKSLLLNETLPGTYFDAAPLMMLSSASLDALQVLLPDSVIDVRRFRPNLVIEVEGAEPGIEQSWIGERLQIGDATAKVISPCPRCVMTTRAFEDVPQDRHVLRAIVDNFARNFGVYAKITSPGRVAIGSEIQPV